MNDGEINPKYEVVSEANTFGIFGREEKTGESVLIKKVSPEAETVFRLAEILNENRVSVHHAKDVLRDLVLEPLLE
ncbi:MAG: hypothetical protein IKL18_04460 [Oscillospiraceae bacterium]|nr:hypothetical protein [Oscillospiraceae bacterium]